MTKYWPPQDEETSKLLDRMWEEHRQRSVIERTLTETWYGVKVDVYQNKHGDRRKLVTKRYFHGLDTRPFVKGVWYRDWEYQFNPAVKRASRCIPCNASPKQLSDWTAADFQLNHCTCWRRT